MSGRLVSLGYLADGVGDQPTSEDSGDTLPRRQGPHVATERPHPRHQQPCAHLQAHALQHTPWGPGPGLACGGWRPAALPQRQTRSQEAPGAPSRRPEAPSTRRSLGWCCHDPRPVCARWGLVPAAPPLQASILSPAPPKPCLLGRAWGMRAARPPLSPPRALRPFAAKLRPARASGSVVPQRGLLISR